MTSEAEISNQLHDVFAAFNETFAGITETQMLRQDFDKWNLKDIIAHVTGWNEVMGESLERVARGDSPVRIGFGVEIFDPGTRNLLLRNALVHRLKESTTC